MIDSVLDRLSRLHPKIIDLSLDRVLRLLAALGHPEMRLPPVVHVAGTNGKGSTIAFLRAFFEAAGRRAHVYTSPHLVRFAERIRVAGSLPDDRALLALLEEVEAANAGAPITFFEITTAAAFLAFSRTPADVCLLETGLGGRLDATNVVAQPALTVITPIALDHQQLLGDTIAAIAAEKAAIIKPGTPCVVALQQPQADRVIAKRAAAVGAPLIKQGRDFSVCDNLVYTSAAVEWALPPPGLTGAFQSGNAALALAAIERLGGVDAAALARGMAGVDWPARMQRLTRGPLAGSLPEGWELWLDGGHNPHAAAAIALHAQGWRDRPLYAVCGMLENKDIDGYFKHVGPCVQALRGVAIPGEHHALPAETVAAKAAAHGVPETRPAPSVGEAIGDLATHPGPARIIICGSLYLAGTVLAENG